MKKTKQIYHSALKKQLIINNELTEYSKAKSYVFQWDLTKGIPDIYKQCDLIYVEPSWSQGYDIFQKRCNDSIDRSNYLDYMIEISRYVNSALHPVYIILEKKIQYLFKQPSEKILVNLHNYKSDLLIFNDNLNIDNLNITNLTNYNIINILAEKYNLVGDFCCGYGNTAKVFREHNKNFICSDINAKCVYYIAKELMGYDK